MQYASTKPNVSLKPEIFCALLPTLTDWLKEITFYKKTGNFALANGIL